MVTALAITMVMHIVVLTLLVDREYMLWDLQVNANMAPRRLMHSGRSDRNGTATSAVVGNHGNEKHLEGVQKFKRDHHMVVQHAEGMMNIHDNVNIHDYRRVMRKIGYIKRRHNLNHDESASKKHSDERKGESVKSTGGAIWSIDGDMTIEGLMPIKPVLPPTGGDRIT